VYLHALTPEIARLNRCAVVGASGYSGAELVSLLSLHPETRLQAVVGDSSAGRAWESLHPARAHHFRGTMQAFDADALAGLDVVFLALPHGASARAAAALRGRVGHVIDLSGDLRLPDADSYRAWYGQEHPAPELLGQAAYGLPELFGCALPGASLVACAGCYATVSQLAAAPAIDAEGEGPAAVTISAMSGTTGAGRKADLALSFSEVAGNLRAYRVGRHQHAPEIAQGLTRYSGRRARVTFVPHLVPIARGILATVVVANERALSQDALLDRFRAAYAGKPFVRVLDPRERLPEVTDVVGTNFCTLAPVVDAGAGTLVIVGVIDNLVKGAAGQAVQVMNVVLGLPETTGLLPPDARGDAS
jgi:N-acetyl-gamma-glutamyl-phosphate reductase